MKDLEAYKGIVEKEMGSVVPSVQVMYSKATGCYLF